MKTFILTDESLNTYGFWLPLSGAQLDQFRRNPIMLWMHNRAWRGTKEDILPIGRWDNIRVEKGKLLADAVFDENDEFAAAIADKVENNILRMASCGIRVIESSSDPKHLKPGQTCETPTKWALREASIVDIGANDNALSLVFYDDQDEIINLSDNQAAMPLKTLDTNSQTQTNMKKLFKLMELAEDAGEDKAIEKFQALVARAENAEAAQQNAEKKLSDLQAAELAGRQGEAKDLLDAAVKDGRVNADSRKNWEKLFEADHNSAKLSLASIPVRKSVKDQLGDEGEDKEREPLSKMSWDELDKNGKLRNLKDKYPDLYAEKFEAKFGKKPGVK